MRTESLEPAPGLLTDVLAGLDEAGDRRARQRTAGRRAAYLGGLAAATAAGVGGGARAGHPSPAAA